MFVQIQLPLSLVDSIVLYALTKLDPSMSLVDLSVNQVTLKQIILVFRYSCIKRTFVARMSILLEFRDPALLETIVGRNGLNESCLNFLLTPPLFPFLLSRISGCVALYIETGRFVVLKLFKMAEP